jgi:tRNA (guanine37-N1)-methyltransferase
LTIKVLTIFPEIIKPALSVSILGRAIERGLMAIQLIDIRDYADSKHRNTDDYPFGGGAGMVMMVQPIVDAIEQNTGDSFRGKRIYLSPRGRVFNQRMAEELAQDEELLLLCGRYEGVDERVIELAIDEEVSIGDYVLTGGEPAAIVVIDAVARLIPGVLGSELSQEDESFSSGLLEYPQYTRPREFRGLSVPEALLSGDHAKIAKWRREKALELTSRRRPDMLT